MVFQTVSRWFAAGKRVPLIKFRKGGYLQASGGAAPATKQAGAISKPTTASRTQGAAIEDWELPPRYWRKPIDPVEEEYINRGGPA